MRHQLAIEQLTASGNSARITLDGEPLRGVTGFTLAGTVGRRTVLTVDLLVYPVDYFGEVSVVVHKRAHESLLRLGWRPPLVSLVKEATR